MSSSTLNKKVRINNCIVHRFGLNVLKAMVEYPNSIMLKNKELYNFLFQEKRIYRDKTEITDQVLRDNISICRVILKYNGFNRNSLISSILKEEISIYKVCAEIRKLKNSLRHK